MRKTNFVVHWEFILIAIAAILLLRELYALYVIWQHRRLLARFRSGDWEGLQKKVLMLRNKSDLLSMSKWSRRMRLVHDDLCVILASLAYCAGEEQELVRWLNVTKSGDVVVGKELMLALFYRAKGMPEEAQQYYRACQAGGSAAEKQFVLLDYYFSGTPLPEGETIGSLCAEYKNPAIRKLVQENARISPDSETRDQNTE